ncbi:hypothetical protein CP873_04540 [Cutibacterium acnes]|nr:hypothetical protein HMPREF9603_02337 [Cutibacterium acnes HL001PA1]EFT09382.1 hypothetical protein HMPREF9619_02160 [Cutibacterium acnes HL082PA2]EGE71142.1 hypothetical protein HMPREF9341_00855 [Cutibacterium acnes HL103PA1]PGF57149.1 hypothetical protein B1C76_04230 [Cutibacterium acnes subsp. defendens]REB54576.1 hypothetical protein CP868_00865 [Cutibacterium acnes]
MTVVPFHGQVRARRSVVENSVTDVTGSLRGFEEPELIIMDTTHKGGPGGEDAAILLVKWRIFRVRGTMNEIMPQSGTGWSSRDVRRGSPLMFFYIAPHRTVDSRLFPCQAGSAWFAFPFL